MEIDRKEKKVVSHYELAKHETIWMTLESFEKESKNDTTLYLVRELLNIKQKQWKLYHEEDLLADL